jgi:Uma2 family endonuclease
VADATRFTTADLELPPDIDGWRYEIIDGEMHASKTPDWGHQYAADRAVGALFAWSQRSAPGLTLTTPGIVFSDDNNVIPDAIWNSEARLFASSAGDKRLDVAPELVIEVLSAGPANERRDRELKLDLYDRRGVDEYWLIDWRGQIVDIYRRDGAGHLSLATRLSSGHMITSPLLPGFELPVDALWLPGNIAQLL